MIINLLCKALIAILDILLLDFYLKNIYPDVYKKKFRKICFFPYLIIFLGILLIKDILMYINIYMLTILLLITVYFIYRINIFDLLKNILSFFIYKFFIQIIIILILSWLFNTKAITFYSNESIIYTSLSYAIANYIIFITIIFAYKPNLNVTIFKIQTILIFTYFSSIFIIESPALFFIPSIARTYIFTVVISIVALICFDRMQTKYETDKHNKEAIIQNMAKEEEFVQELEKQQLEIRKINHNLNHILIILQSHLKQGEYKEALEYIDKNLDIHIKAYQALTHTGMTMIDSTINHQIYQMKEQNIEYDEDITKILHLGSIVPDDLSLVLGLAFDNAREACEKVKDQRKISLKLQSKQTHIIIHITNSIPRGSHPYFHKTSKKDSVAHGYGVKGIKEIAKKYHGDVKYDVKDDCVILRIMLQK